MNTSASHTVVLALLTSLSAGLAAQQPAKGETIPAAPPSARSTTRFDAPAPLPVTAAEQTALATPQRPDSPPTMRPEPMPAFPWLGGMLAANSLPAFRGVLPITGLEHGPGLQPNASSCTIGFADYIGLLILPDRAGYTFASSPFYIEGCGSGWVHVKENDVARYGASWGSSYGHYHLMYEKGTYCVPSGGNYGYQSGSSCVKVTDPATEPRYLASHHGTQWIRVYVYKSGVAEMTFDFKSIRVKGAQGIKLYFRKADGSWWHWNDLGTGTWNVAPYAAGIREILFRASNNSASSFSVDNIGVAVN